MKNIVFLLVFMLFGFGILYFLLKSEESASALQNALTGDDDKDGIINGVDQEKNTLWLTDTTTFKLRNYVAADGTLDRIKVDSLCNCFEVPDSAERAKIKCKDNAEYFVFEGKLWRYDEATNRFYDKDNNIIKSQPNEITAYHDKIIATFKNNDDNISSNMSGSNDGNTEIEYKNVKYIVSKKLTSETGLVFNDADFRFYSGIWETRKNSGTGSWVKANANEINFLLANIGQKVNVNTEASPKAETKEVVETIPISKPVETSNSGNAADMFYLGYCAENDPFKLFLNVICNEADRITNYKGGDPKTTNGKKAKKNILKHIKEKC